MRWRSLALFTLTTGLALLVGDGVLLDVHAQVNKKNKNKRDDPPENVKFPEPNPAVKAPVASLPVPKTKDAAALAQLIDAAIAQKLAEAKIPASARASDEEFLRRIYLDLTGTIPTAEKAKAFLDDRSPDKRAQLIDELLADPNFGRRMADIWTAKLFPRDSANRFVLKEPLYDWLQEQFNNNTSWDKLVTSLVTATGTVADNPAVTYFLANRSVDKLTDTTAQHFLGIQLQCAQCHNHPFTSWKQVEYWGMAGFYAKVQADNPKNANKGGDNTQIGVREGFTRSRQKDFFPESTKNVPVRFLSGEQPKLEATQPYRPALAQWMTAPENPFFSRALVNRLWAHLFGYGFVNPIDDMLPENTPSHPQLLDSLAHHIATTGQYDVKYLLKAICLSETYQRTSKSTPDNKDDKTLFSHMTVKVLTPEQLFDALTQVTGAQRTMGKGGRVGVAPKGARAGAREQFVNFFLAGAEEASVVDYEAGIPQALRLMNSPITNNPAVVRAIVGNSSPAEAIERIYLTALSRRPTAEERKNLMSYVERVGGMTAYSDILWAVLNSSEFTLVR
ncbi:MAG: DUF1549 and DUF1553 domain-containing protein [Gemmataceae bacterium]|nr:DUF1549 and DUF1553 domain-containing protein [Gemmata sp.]MDW8198232.1 DUF1549 and DUF1553 domain-containing protein [Gemmataceae bacterium]